MSASPFKLKLDHFKENQAVIAFIVSESEEVQIRNHLKNGRAESWASKLTLLQFFRSIQWTVSAKLTDTQHQMSDQIRSNFRLTVGKNQQIQDVTLSFGDLWWSPPVRCGSQWFTDEFKEKQGYFILNCLENRGKCTVTTPQNHRWQNEISCFDTPN